MSKNIRVAWDDLKPGDKVHPKGTSNIYLFRSWPREVIDGDLHDVAIVEIPSTCYQTCFFDKDLFAYATRPAPKKPRLVEPERPGEYWFGLKMGNSLSWCKAIRRGHMLGDGFGRDEAWMWVAQTIIPVTWTDWKSIIEHNRVVCVLSAEEYYTRKIKGEL